MSSLYTLNSLYKYKAWANKEIFESLSSIDEESFPDKFTLSIRILNHVYVVDEIFKNHLIGEKPIYLDTNTKETPELGNLITKVNVTDLWFINYVESLSEEALSNEIEFKFVDGALGRMSKHEILMHIITHGGYHRGAVGRVLAEMSLVPPRDIFTRFLHESDPSRRIA